MANPRQRQKARSKTHKAVSHSKRAKQKLKKTPTIRGPKALQDAWDNRKTLRQNYAALGLLHTLNPSSSGGVEPLEGQGVASEQSNSGLMGSSSATTSAIIPKGHGKIIRDSSGNIVGVVLADEDQVPAQTSGRDMDMEQLEPTVDQSVLEKWALRKHGAGETKGVVAELERISSTVAIGSTSTTVSVAISGVGARHASKGEVAYMRRLVETYGQDVDRMAKDHRLNYDQRSAGKLRRALQRAGLDGESRIS
ncbi:hypothetical protein BDN72DRAFT_831186 [Pluteus cervinus]|uniref:Uncharacterized protein n=1 Tax=Pluteus cervinus TaxID=181527 RepID=A0ACD3BFF5_9AGAR|nr:hypothetical protein BDN72DRAFT_831186 [Pluteus cervinus]